MAEAFAKFYGSEDLKAYSAGSKPSGTINPQAINVMRETGYNLATHRSKSLSDIPDIEFDAAVTMGAETSVRSFERSSIKTGTSPPQKGRSLEEVRRIRDLIRDRVQELLKHSK